MKIQTKLSKRDSILLAVLFFFLVAIGGFFFILKPAATSINLLENDLLVAKDKMKLVETSLAQKDSIEAAYKEVAAKAKIAADDFFDEMQPQEIEKIIGEFLDEHYIEYTSISVESFTQTQVQPYTFQQPIVSYPLKDFANEINGISDTPPVLDENAASSEENTALSQENVTSLEEANVQVSQDIATEIAQATVTVEFVSTFNNLLAFTDFVANYKQLLRIDNLSVSLLPEASDVVKGSLALSLKGAAKAN